MHCLCTCCPIVLVFAASYDTVYMSHDACRELSKYQRDGSFPEIKGYKPNVRIVHVDDSGRELSIKEVLLYLP